MSGTKITTKLIRRDVTGAHKDIAKILGSESREHAKKVQKLLELRGMTVKVGVVGERANEKHEGDAQLTMAQLASIHEYGLGNVPARPFLKIPLTSNRQKYRELIRAAFLATKGSKNKGPDFAKFKSLLARVGAEGVKDVREFVRRVGVPPELSQSWLEYKKSQRKSLKPLIFTGQLIRAISYLVTKRRGKIGS